MKTKEKSNQNHRTSDENQGKSNENHRKSKGQAMNSDENQRESKGKAVKTIYIYIYIGKAVKTNEHCMKSNTNQRKSN